MQNISVSSEISPIKKVIIHTPGEELEKMTPETAEELLYDDILNPKAAKEQHQHFTEVLKQVCEPCQLVDLLEETLRDEKNKEILIDNICRRLDEQDIQHILMGLDSRALAKQLISGTEINRNTLERFLSPNIYSLPPLPNLFFTRDSAMIINQCVFIGNMASRVRMTEAMLMSHIFHYHPDFMCDDFLVNATEEVLPNIDITFEGGDILILRHDTILIGMSERTNAPGIDYLIEQFKKRGRVKHVFVVILPKIRATIHLDMVFTMVDVDKAVVFPPLILAKEAVDVIHVDINSTSKPKLKRYPYLLDALKQVDIDLEPVKCGGESELYQKREQWQSGANFFTIAPGKMIGYGMNEHTFDELKKAGIPRIEAQDVVNGRVNLNDYDKYAIAIAGNELTRGGGGARCMTMPVLRE